MKKMKDASQKHESDASLQYIHHLNRFLRVRPQRSPQELCCDTHIEQPAQKHNSIRTRYSKLQETALVK